MSGVEVERGAHGVATVWLSNPGRLNALSNKMVIGLCEELPRLAADDACRAIVLRGRGGVFCAGRDLADLKALQAADADAIKAMYGHMQKMNEAVYYSPQPVISVVEKYAFGIASMLVSWTDVAIAEDNAQLGYPEVHHGITPYGAVPTMLNTMSQKAMMDLLLTGRRIKADEALRLGLLTRVVPAAGLGAALDEVLEHLSRGSAAAIRKSKQFVRQCEAMGYREAIAAATEKHIHGLLTPELQQGLAAFADRKKAS